MSARARAFAPFAFAGLLYVGLRLSILWRFPGFLDETAYARWAERVHDSVNDRFVALAYGKLPLLSWLGAGFVYAGIAPLDAVRLVSFCSGLVTLAVTALLAARLGGRPVAIAAAFIYVFLPLVFVHDVIGIMEPLVTALLALALYLEIRLAERPTPALALTLGLVLGAGLLTKETGQLAVALLPLSLLVFDWNGPRLLRRFAAWAGYALIATALAGIAYLVLTLSELWDDYPASRSSLGAARNFGEGVSHPLRWLEGTWPGHREHLLGYVTAPLLVACVVGLVFAFIRRWRVAALYVVWLLSPLLAAILFLASSFVRYLVPLAPLIAVFAAYGVVVAIEVLGAALRRPRLVAAAIAALALIPALWFDSKVVADPGTAPYPGSSREEYVSGWAAGTGWPELADELRQRAGSSTLVVAWYDGFNEALTFALDNDARIQVVRGSPGNQGPEASSDYVIQNGYPLPGDTGYGALQEAWRFQRPYDGTPLVLYRRGVMWDSRFYATPEELRRGLGLPDAEFDGFIADHPEIGDWYRAVTSR